MRQHALALAGIAAIGAASGAHAAVSIIAPTTVTTAPLVTFDGGINFSQGYTDGASGNPFVETLSWNNTLAGSYGITLSTESLGVAANDIDFFATGACATCGAFLSGGDIVGFLQLAADADNSDANEDYRLTTGTLAAGNYTLTFRGTGQGSFGGNVAFAAVPEPGSWAMMLLGFAAAGFSLRRSRKSAPQPA